MAYKHCSRCGQAFDQRTWQRETYCCNCGKSLRHRDRRDEPLNIDPYPDCAPSLSSGEGINALLDELVIFAKEHPLLFSAGAITVGVGGILLGPSIIALGKTMMLIGSIMLSFGMISVVYAEKGEAEQLISAGVLTLIAGAGVGLVGYAITIGGIVAVVAGTGVATKTTVEYILIKRIEKQLREKSVAELLKLSKQLN